MLSMVELVRIEDENEDGDGDENVIWLRCDMEFGLLESIFGDDLRNLW